ncbi:MAG: YncE family protein [Rhodospirillaceae bacterium]|nr:MAG: YncE family protein [Rhodospirillaceae bacterium]
MLLLSRRNLSAFHADRYISRDPGTLTISYGAKILRTFRPHQKALIAAAAALYVATGGFALGQETVDVPPINGYVYTANELGNSISAINLADGQVQTVPVAISPHNIQISADGGRLFAVGNPAMETGHDQHQSGQEAEMEGMGGMEGLLLVYDPARLPQGPLASIKVGEHPAHVVVDQGGSRAFVTLAGQNAVAVVDLAARKVVKTIQTGAYPHGLRLSPDGSVAYVANVEDGSVSILDTTKLTETSRIPVGRAPVQVGFTPDGRQVFVSLRDENKVTVLDTTTHKILAKIDVGRNPIQVFATPDGKFVYVANQGSKEEPADTASVIDVATYTVVATIRTGPGAHGVVTSTDGRYVFVSNIVAGTVSMIDVENRRVARQFLVGTGPNGITFQPQRP